LIGELQLLHSYTIQESSRGEILWKTEDLSPAEVVIEAIKLITTHEYHEHSTKGKLVRTRHDIPIILSVNKE
jgi:hypothetical protein